MMKNLNGRAHNACYHPYYQQQLQQQRHQQQLLQQQQQQQQLQQQQHLQQQQQQSPFAANYNQLQQQQQQQLQQYNNQQYYNQQLQQQQEQLLRQQQQQQQHQQQLPTLPTYQQQQQHSKQSYNNNNAANMAMSARSSNLHATVVAAATTNSNINGNNNNSSSSNANTTTASAAMAAMCQMQSFLNQQQQQQHQQQQQQQQQQQYNNNCAHINYNQQQQQQQQHELPAAAATTNGDKLALDASEIANILASELFMQQLVSFDGMQSVPTLTTPTLTPTTLRTIEETIFELTSEPQNVPFQAGFKPPPLTTPVNSSSGGSNTGTPTSVSGTSLAAVVNAIPIASQQQQQQQQQFDLISMNCSSVPGSDSEDSNGSWNDGQLNDDQSTTDSSSAATDSTSYQNGAMLGNGSNGVANNFTAALAAVNSASRSGQAGGSSNSNTSNSATPARRGGGRRPNKAANMSPEEEEKRRIRRERNKLAAARCRKRRVDQTNELSEEVEALQKKGENLKKEIEKLNATKNQLEYVIQSHRHTCQKVRDDLLSVATCNGLIGPAALLSAGSCSGSSLHNNSNSNDSSSGTITGFDATLNSTGRSNSPLDLKPVLTNEQLLQHIKHEPQDGALESGSSLDQDGPTPAKRFALPNMATLSASLTTPTGPTGSLNTPLGSAPPGSFSAFAGNICNMSSPTLNALNKLPKARPNTLNVQRPFGAAHMQPGVEGGKAPMQIQGVPIQTPSTGTFNFDSLMDGGTGLTPVSGPLMPTCSSQNKHPLELPTPTSEPSKLVSL